MKKAIMIPMASLRILIYNIRVGLVCCPGGVGPLFGPGLFFLVERQHVAQSAHRALAGHLIPDRRNTIEAL